MLSLLTTLSIDDVLLTSTSTFASAVDTLESTFLMTVDCELSDAFDATDGDVINGVADARLGLSPDPADALISPLGALPFAGLRFCLSRTWLVLS